MYAIRSYYARPGDPLPQRDRQGPHTRPLGMRDERAREARGGGHVGVEAEDPAHVGRRLAEADDQAPRLAGRVRRHRAGVDEADAWIRNNFV